jgi:hypothetical protein
MELSFAIFIRLDFSQGKHASGYAALETNGFSPGFFISRLDIG